MAQDLMQYGQMVEDSLRGVVRQALSRAATDGLLGDHHFYIGFKTQFPGVDIPDHLGLQYPEEMTIVIQHKFWGLEVHEDAFEITLSFSGQGQRLYIPFQALTSFLDPSVQFGLQFGQQEGEAGAAEDGGEAPAPSAPETVVASEKKSGDSENGDNVVTLDQFRKD
ncbi:MAG: ClpXP protease specificity-enhancing factor SspB [Alphaproteobacteria bacterium]|nr:ClpXP protease specificity-enhancing factor SspB [Alphaproteobacteria bacterium]MDP6830377.1 ClpXP protease specificity-enhancing factor SspB [Alphaproteobacteria bacterium]